MTTKAKACIQNKTVTVFALEDNRHLATFARSARKSLAKRVAQWEATNDCKVANLAEILVARIEK